ncbi:MAG TPA: SWIM zinc finger family protein [Methanocorpusculum sp.]|nr:SWIM zinc finger family protein [Methanocorpusculum sp.]
MTNPFQILKAEGELNDVVRNAFISAYGNRGMEAVDAVKENRIKKYRDYFVVVGNTGEYYLEGSFCSCDAFLYGKKCWHTLAVQIAVELGLYETYDLWYYKNGVDEDEPEYE